MSTTIVSFQNRVVIETLHNEGRSLRYIANYLDFSQTTIFNELHRLNGEYQAELAQTDFERKVSQRGRKSSLTKNLKHLIEEKIQVQKWSPEQVAHVVGIAYKTVYNWIDQGWLDVQLPDLPDHGIRRHRAKEKRGTFSHGRSIEKRPHKIETRQEFGHFEADTVLSGKRKGQAVATFVERKSRLTTRQLQDKLKTLTVDHGKEFANYQTIERRTGTQVYFAHAYSPHERGSNENRNRVLRRFIPKGQAIEELSDHQLVQINWYLNSRPLKCLNWHTPIEIFLLNLRH
ncbi:IS30 family transposase [Levilactobacillus brevis]|uniref:IS30 family transposase n=2 Tax=Lactobacillaceae TaxID=33958 RepID=UPI000572EDC0|nr:IS30 family transposase [Levilactobacillus brevis]AJA81560.1 integrase [Levilactobacillus brevis BSO 464]